MPVWLIVLLVLSIAPAHAGQRMEVLRGLFVMTLPDGLIPGQMTGPEVEPPRAEFLRPGLAAGVKAAGLDPGDPVVAAIRPPPDLGEDLRGRIFLVRVVPSILAAGRGEEARFAADCALIFPGAATLRWFDPARRLGHCAVLGEVPRDGICSYAIAETVCGGGHDAIELALLDRDAGYAGLSAAWDAMPEREGEAARATVAALIDRIRGAVMAADVEAMLLSLQMQAR